MDALLEVCCGTDTGSETPLSAFTTLVLLPVWCSQQLLHHLDVHVHVVLRWNTPSVFNFAVHGLLQWPLQLWRHPEAPLQKQVHVTMCWTSR